MSDHLDFETRSRVDLKKVGLWAYAMHPSTQITCFTVGTRADDLVTFRGLERKFDWTWSPGQTVTQPWVGGVVTAHNASFEYAIYNLILHRRFGWPARWDPKLWRCTMAKAYACGLPGSLDDLGRVLRLRTVKDLDGKKAMLRTCKPLANGTFDETPEVYQTLYAYNRTDVVTEIEADAQLPDLSPYEQLVWEHTLMLNRRGIQIDLALAAKAAEKSEHVIAGLNKKLNALTGGAVDKATQVKSLTYYLADHHAVNVSSLDKESITGLLQDPLIPETAREVLLIRRQVGKKTSVAKYLAALEQACPDGRVRGMHEYHGAHTGRYAGRGLQPQNFPKGWGKPELQAQAIADIMELTPDQFLAKYGAAAMDALSDSLRGLFIAAPGKTIVCADFNAIEARVVFWLAGAESALAAYRRGESPYLEMARAIYPNAGLPEKLTAEVKKTQQYDIGKRTILGCGFSMSWEKFRDNIYAETAKTGKPVVISDALAQRAVQTYRDKYGEVKSLWYEVENAAINAVLDPQGRGFPCAGGKVVWGMTKDKRFLLCRLPSGRYLRYFKPLVKEVWVTFCKNENCKHMAMVAKGYVRDVAAQYCEKREKRNRLYYETWNPWSGQWGPTPTYGGALVENITQAVARDLLVHGMLSTEAAGYPSILTVHDEVGAEVAEEKFPKSELQAAADDDQMLDNFIGIMCKTPAWAAGCPVAAEGWVGPRYHK